MHGLTTAEVEARCATGRTNDVPAQTSRSWRGIVTSNLFTRFNAIIASLAVIVLALGHPIDALFALVMVANVAIGIVQEARAKRVLDALQVLVAPTVTAVRDGRKQTVPIQGIVEDDVLLIRAGDQIPADARVVDSSGLEVDESALTGESDPVAKTAGDDVLSGSAAVAGAATLAVQRVGTDAFIHDLVAQAKEFTLARSELRLGIERFLRAISWALPPITALLFWSQLRNDAPFDEGMVAAAAGVVALVPQGLVLLVSMAMAVAVIGLAKRSVVVQELPAVEGLARADVVCLDKTGTLTTGRMRLESILPVDGESQREMEHVLATLARVEPSPTSALRTIGTALSAESGPADAEDSDVVGLVPFSSQRKWSAVRLASHGTWLLGAPEILLPHVRATATSDLGGRVESLTSDGRRLLLLARSDLVPEGRELVGDLIPAGLVVLAEELRTDAADTMAYFESQGVAVKIISGDSARTVAAIGAELRIPGADRWADMSRQAVSGDLVESTTVFGRVRPEQKREIVEALQERGHTVAMTGDGVNDIPALKAADIGIAMDTATSATRAVAQLVLLDGRFDLLPAVVAEGRRIVANMERVAALFLAKTVYAAIFAIAIGFTATEFPFLPRHLTLVDSLTIGIPAFALSFRAADDPCRPGFVGRVLRFAIPTGIAAAAVTLGVYALARGPLGTDLAEARSLATLALGLIGFWILYWLIRPLDLIAVALLAGLGTVFLVALGVDPISDFYALALPGTEATALVLTAAVAGVLVTHTSALAVDKRHTSTARPHAPDDLVTQSGRSPLNASSSLVDAEPTTSERPRSDVKGAS